MKRKFKSKKHIKMKKCFIYIIYIIIIFLIIVTLNYFSKLKIITTNPIEILKYSNNYTNRNLTKQLKKISSMLTGIDINKPITILSCMNIYITSNSEESKTTKNQKEIFYVSNNPIENIEKKSNEPLVYIYNTHQTEQYKQNVNEPYSITPDVMVASYYLEEKLEQMGINTIVEETKISEILQNNNWNYNQSYKASKINLEKIKNQYPSIKIFIDLHRDAVSKEISTTTIEEKNYAKVLFLIGKDHDNYEQNLEFSTSINNIIVKNYPSLTRGIMQKGGIGVNGIYNQDVAPNVILLEVGGNNNTIDEVTNTLDIISNIIKEKINEK